MASVLTPRSRLGLETEALNVLVLASVSSSEQTPGELMLGMDGSVSLAVSTLVSVA